MLTKNKKDNFSFQDLSCVYATFWFNKTKNFIPYNVLENISGIFNLISKKTQVKKIFFVHNDIRNVTESFFPNDIEIIDIAAICPKKYLPVFDDNNDITLMIDFGKHLIINYLMGNFINYNCIVSDADANLDIFKNYDISPRSVSISSEDLNYYERNPKLITIDNWFVDSDIWELGVVNLGMVDNNGENQFYAFSTFISNENFTFEKLINCHYNNYVKEMGNKIIQAIKKNPQILKINFKDVILSEYYPNKINRIDKTIRELLFKDFLDLFKNYEELSYFIHELFVPYTTLDKFYDVLGLNNHNEVKYTLPFELTSYSENGLSDKDEVIIYLLSEINKNYSSFKPERSSHSDKKA